MSQNSVEVRSVKPFSLPSSEAHEALVRLTGEQLKITHELYNRLAGIQREVEKLTSSFPGMVFASMGGHSLPSLDHNTALDGLSCCFELWRVTAAADELIKEVQRQRGMLLGFSQLFDGMEVRHD
jgi:hypothetical protein